MIRRLSGLAMAGLLAMPAGAQPPWRIDLTGGTPAPGFTAVTPERTGAGFLVSTEVPEGLYRVTVTLGDAHRAGRTTIKAEARRLMLLDLPTRRGETVRRSFLVAVRTPRLAPPPANAPGGDHVRIGADEARSPDWDDRLTLEFLGDPRVRTVEIEPAQAPTLYLAGDSTVADQPFEPVASWGQMLPALLDDRIAVANHAWSGETLKSFLTGLRLDKLLSQAKAGDWLLIQFGHNDQKQAWPQTYADPALRYPAYLRAYIAEARSRGLSPILVTPPERRNFLPDHRLAATLADYVTAVKRVAAEDHVPLIDLNAASRAIYEGLGPDLAPLAFNERGADRTHNDNYGAWLLANAVAQGLGRIAPLAGHVAPQALRFDPAHPPQPAAVTIPQSAAHAAARPAGS
jgi:lysophospholipase L1-like esterase